MPEEFSRTTANKRINGVLVPVITQISFIDPVRQYQEYQYTVDNSGNADRDVHVDNVNNLQVERIDVWKYLDPVQRYQEKQVTFDNNTKGDPPPPYFPTHEKTHVVRYTAAGGSFVDSELIDEFKIVDAQRQYQEYWYTLDNPPGEDDGQGHFIVTANPDDPDITDTDNGVDPPYRTDPFQNIVNTGTSTTKPAITIHVRGGFAQGTTFTAGGGFNMDTIIDIVGATLSFAPFPTPVLDPPGTTPRAYRSNWTPPGFVVDTSPDPITLATFTQTGNISANAHYETVGGLNVTVSASIDTSAWVVTMPGQFYGYNGTLHFHVHLVQLGASDPSNQFWNAYMYSDELGQPGVWPP